MKGRLLSFEVNCLQINYAMELGISDKLNGNNATWKADSVGKVVLTIPKKENNMVLTNFMAEDFKLGNMKVKVWYETFKMNPDV